jgi:hypothetical protein
VDQPPNTMPFGGLLGSQTRRLLQCPSCNFPLLHHLSIVGIRPSAALCICRRAPTFLTENHLLVRSGLLVSQCQHI